MLCGTAVAGYAGFGGAWVGSLTALEPFRPYLIGLRLLLLGYAFYKIYTRPKAEACAPGSYCANPKSDRINKITLWISTFFVMALLSLPYLVSAISANPSAQTESISADYRQVVLDVSGMSCASCPLTVQQSLKNLDGVISAKATLEDKTAQVIFDPSKVTIEVMIAATTNAGYPATVHIMEGR